MLNRKYGLMIALIAMGKIGSVQAGGDCRAMAERYLNEMETQRTDKIYQQEDVVSSACKIWPKDEALTILSFAFDDGKEEEKGFVVALLETEKDSVVASYQGTIEEDAAMTVGGCESLRIDTARYDLAPGIRAFGVDLRSCHVAASCPDGGSGHSRTLFIQDGKALKPILQDFTLSSWRFVAGESCSFDSSEVRTQVVTYSLGIAPSSTQGFADLLVIGKAEITQTGQKRPSTFRYTLRYDGKMYPTSDLWQARWDWEGAAE